MKAILLGTYYQILNLIRVRKAFFFSFIFPLFLFCVFVFVWGNDSVVYAKFILTGIIATISLSNSMMAIGRIIVQYNKDGMARLLKSIPFAYEKHLVVLIFSRVIFLIVASFFLVTFSVLVMSLSFSVKEILDMLLGVVTGVFFFSLLGLIVAELLEDKDSEGDVLTNGIFYLLIFMSDCFFPVSEMHYALGLVVTWNPVTPILHVLRDESGWCFVLLSELLLFVVGSLLLSRRTVQKR